MAARGMHRDMLRCGMGMIARLRKATEASSARHIGIGVSPQVVQYVERIVEVPQIIYEECTALAYRHIID